MNTIIELRTQRGMTQDEFAEYCGVSRISIARYEAGARISTENAERIASACHVSVDWVLGRADPQKKEAAHSDGLDARFKSRAALLTQENLVKLDAYLDGLLAGQDTKAP